MPDEVVSFLTRCKKLIRRNRCRFVPRKYHGKSHVEVLFNDFGISILEALQVILSLTKHDYFVDPLMDAYKTQDTYCFKREVHGVIAYIKIQIAQNKEGEEAVVLSFHQNR